jgi:ankyrin repeat protein
MATRETGSAILDAMYHNRRDEAARLMASAAAPTVWEASALGADRRLLELLDADPSLVNAYAPDGHTPLGLACFFAGPSTAKLLVERGADVAAAARNDMKVQPLHAAAAARNVEAVVLLLERGADPDARQQAGYTALMAAAGAGRRDLVDMLLARGADPGLVSDAGKTAADLAREHGHESIADALVRRASGR